MLCVLAVFIPSFFMEGAARALFVPLSLAVGFAMVASYLLSSTFVPVLSVWLLRHYHQPHESEASRFSFVRIRNGYTRLLRWLMPLRWVIVPAYLAAAGLLIWLVGGQVGREIFPTVDAGQFQLRMKAPTGTRIEVTEQMAIEAPRDQGDGRPRQRRHLGRLRRTHPLRLPRQHHLFVDQRSGGGRAAGGLQIGKRCARRTAQETAPRKALSRAAKVAPRTAGGSERSAAQVEQRVAGIKLSFEPSDIVNEVMSFGSPTPVEVAVERPQAGRQTASTRKKSATSCKKFPRCRTCSSCSRSIIPPSR